MRSPYLFCLFLLFPLQSLWAQDVRPGADERVGIYRAKLDPTLILQFSSEAGELKLQVMGQGKIPMTVLSPTRFRLKIVKPTVTLEFIKDVDGHISLCRLYQPEPSRSWTKLDDSSTLSRKEDSFAEFIGNYLLPINPYRVFHVTEKEGRLFCRIADQQDAQLLPLGKEHFRFTREGYDYEVAFKRDGVGRIESLVTSGSHPIDLLKTASAVPRVSNRTNGYTRADTVQGTLTPLRTCYDVLFYDLDLTILPGTKSIRGSNLIRWKTIQPFSRMQVDLYANLGIDRILFHDRELTYTRDGNAVLIDLPATAPRGSTDELRIVYSGQPLVPDIDALKGGIFWLWNRDRKLWIESVTQGIGASVFWPCKDHLSDRPDSMRISITVPRGLTDISNGRLLSKTEIAGEQTRFEWYVDYPIVTYDVVINIGDYAHFSDSCINGGRTLPLNYYCMPYNVDSARRLFSDVKRMLALYEKDFGPYPFPGDGFTLVEGIYAMDHQGAVCIGSMRSPFNSDRYDGDIRRTMWHESAHEWWGNSVGCSDYADMWIHESFADYAEFLNRESSAGRATAVRELIRDHPQNKEPIIGVYNVNHFHMGDMYLKGSLLLQTLRNVIGDDSLWFAIFRDIQQRFRYQPVRTEDIVEDFNRISGKDYTWFFDQYLRHPAIPVLALTFQQEGDRLLVGYKWAADVPGFHMPIKVTLAKDSLAFIYPTDTVQTMELKGMTQKDFAVDTDEFYVGVRYICTDCDIHKLKE